MCADRKYADNTGFLCICTLAGRCLVYPTMSCILFGFFFWKLLVYTAYQCVCIEYYIQMDFVSTYNNKSVIKHYKDLKTHTNTQHTMHTQPSRMHMECKVMWTVCWAQKPTLSTYTHDNVMFSIRTMWPLLSFGTIIVVVLPCLMLCTFTCVCCVCIIFHSTQLYQS